MRTDVRGHSKERAASYRCVIEKEAVERTWRILAFNETASKCPYLPLDLVLSKL